MAKKNFYAVVKGHVPGIYENWSDCEINIKGYKGQEYKGFSSLKEALKWYEENGGDMSALSEKYTKTDEVQAISSCKTISDDDDIQSEKLALVNKLQAKLAYSRKNNEKPTKELENFCLRYGFGKLSTQQKLAVQTIQGKSLLFAVPGSGKTTVLIARAGYLLHGQNKVPIRPNMLMNLTFTVAAAKEMATRYAKAFNKYDSDEQPAFMTIHSFCWNKIIPQLRRRNFLMPIRLINTDKQDNQDDMLSDLGDDVDKHETEIYSEEKGITLYKVLKKILIHFKLSRRDDTVREKITSLITSIKNRQLAPEEYQDKILMVEKTHCSVKEIFDIYQDELANYQCMDFDDMLQYSLFGLKEYPDLIKQLQEQYLYWSIDETQDNSRLQNELISLLAGDSGNLFVVGDDDQSIYNFRGAEPMLLLNYGIKDDVKTMLMDTNYRSGKIIINTAKAFISSNIYRADKQMQSRENALHGQINFYTALPTEQEQYNHIVETAKKCIKNNKTLAIIYRLNASSLPVMFWLKKHGIKFNVAKDYREIVWGKVFREVINIMILSIYPGNWAAFKSCLYELRIYLQKEALLRMTRQMKRNTHVDSILDWVLEIQSNLSHYVEKAKDILQQIKCKTPFDAATYILQNVIKSESSAAQRLREYAILSACIPYENITDFIAAHLELDDEVKANQKKDSLITLTSMHSAKGLEFDNVIIIDSWEDIINKKDIFQEPDELRYEDNEEERRLFYVAITRAKNVLDICMPKKYFGNYVTPCSYISELAKCYEEVNKEFVNQLPEEVQSPSDEIQYVFNQPKVYYAVRVGYKTGIFDNWTETELAINGYPGCKHKKFDSLEEAENYIEGYADIAPHLESAYISSVMLNNPISCMQPIDLPKQLNQAIMIWFGVSSLNELSYKQISNIKRQNIVYSDCQETNYHGRVDYYIINYMPVNFYKIWVPLWDILKNKQIKTKAKILELGAGPGTSMLSLIYFYLLLAKDNPKQIFELDYQVVEREVDFVTACKSLVNSFLKFSSTNNFHVNCRIIQKDIYSFAQNNTDDDTYDLILESNVLNGNENIQNSKTDELILALVDKLKENGQLILIEPGKIINRNELNRIMRLLFSYDFIRCESAPRIISVPLTKISLFKKVKEIGLRYSEKAEHWFSYTVFHKEGQI